jgi:hypothetical protein
MLAADLTQSLPKIVARCQESVTFLRAAEQAVG